MLKKIKELFCSNLSRAEYIRISPQIRKANLAMVTILSMFATVLIGAMYLTSMKVEGFKQNSILYLIGLIVSILISIMSVTVAKQHYAIITVLIYLSYAVYYLYGIAIGAITDPKQKTVTLMVLLVFLPTVFIVSKSFIITVTIIHVGLFVLICMKTKHGAILTVDIVDAIVFSLLGLASGTVVNTMKIKGYLLELKLHELGNIDRLTNMRNRNAYENEKYSFNESCKYLGVLYVDVNGLHEVNKQGHAKGDEMLKFIAAEIINTFSAETSYRIGGDEFVAFILDKSETEIEAELKEMLTKIEWKGYHIATGLSVSYSARHADVDYLISESEKKMYIDKNRYYKSIARQARNS